VIQDLHLVIRLIDPPANAAFEVETASGVSSGTSADGAVTVVRLRAGVPAGSVVLQADSVAAGRRAPTELDMDGVGVLVLDHGRRELTMVAAPIGLRQLFWTAHRGTLGLASDPRLLVEHGAGHAPLAPDALFHYVYFHMVPGPLSTFAGVRKLEGGHRLTWQGDLPRTERYWSPQFSDRVQISLADATRQLHQLLGEAVREAMDGRDAAGAFLSGGLDSSTVTGIGAQARPGFPAVTMGFDAAGYDEMPYARAAARHFGNRSIEYYVTPEDVLASLPQIAAALPEPFGNSSAAAAYQCARVARDHGIDFLLAGDGGDELFGGNERYAWQLMFERYQRVPAWFRQTLLEPVVDSVTAVTQVFPFGKARNFIRQANVPLPDRLQSYNFLHRHDPAEVFAPDLLAAVDATAPLCLLREEYAAPATSSAVNRMLFLDWKFTLHDNDLVKVNTMCRLAGVEVAYPMLDQRLIDFSLGLPGDWKVRRGQLRWFYRAAMRGFLPDEILRKRKHGFGLPFGVWMRTHDGLRRLAEDALRSLATRGYFKPAFLDATLERHRQQHASYYGELVWILTVLELWLRARSPNARL
jgi:asparagine synthase (glutamine-hydrolysing)